jgi:ElaB/YqjD/DUF883 family membrane-anchored ribosome-binding protein
MKTNPDSSTRSPQAILDELHTLVQEAENTAGDFAAKPTEDADHALRARFDAAQEHLTEAYQGAKRRIVAGARGTDSAIRANPYTALAIVGGIGLLVGLIVGRRSR